MYYPFSQLFNILFQTGEQQLRKYINANFMNYSIIIFLTVITACGSVTCDCPEQQIFCPPDSVLVESRISDCCVQYECRCPNISCPLLMERGTGVQPVPVFRGNKFPGRCCPLYDYQGKCIQNTLLKQSLLVISYHL